MLFFFGFPGKFAISAELPQPAESLLLAARAAQSLWLQFPVFCASDRFLTFHGASDHPKPEKGPPTMLPLLQIDHPEAEQPDHDQHRKIRVRLRNLTLVVSIPRIHSFNPKKFVYFHSFDQLLFDVDIEMKSPVYLQFRIRFLDCLSANSE